MSSTDRGRMRAASGWAAAGVSAAPRSRGELNSWSIAGRVFAGFAPRVVRRSRQQLLTRRRANAVEQRGDLGEVLEQRRFKRLGVERGGRVVHRQVDLAAQQSRLAV